MIERQARALRLVEQAARLDREVGEHVGAVGADRPAVGSGVGRRRRGRGRRVGAQAGGAHLGAHPGGLAAIHRRPGLGHREQLSEQRPRGLGAGAGRDHLAQRRGRRHHLVGRADLEGFFEVSQGAAGRVHGRQLLTRPERRAVQAGDPRPRAHAARAPDSMRALMPAASRPTTSSSSPSIDRPIMISALTSSGS